MAINERFSIRTAAELVGVVPATLRAYERQGLMRPERNAAGHRLYKVADIHRARQIKAEQREARRRAAREGMTRWLESRA